MTVQRNANRWDKSNVLFRDNGIVEYNKRATRPDMKHIDYGLGAISAQVDRLSENRDRSIWPIFITDCRCQDNSRAMKSMSGFTRSAHTRGSPKRQTILQRGKHELRPAASA